MDRNGTSTTATTSISGIVLYPVDSYFVIVVVLLVVGTLQWGVFLNSKLNSRGPKRSVWVEESYPRKTSASSLPLAIVNFYRVLAFRTTVGFRSYVFNLAELLVAVGYATLLFVWTFIIHSEPEGEPLNWCSRAGLLAASQFFFITVLGTKNNIISLVTRISADKLNFVHRFIARTCLVFVGIHVLGGGNNFPFYKRASNESELYGLVAVWVFAGLAIVSLRPVRERAYELFFYLHYVAIIVIMVATILHIVFYNATNFTYYIWPSFVIWAADRLIRTSRVIYFNLAYFSSSQRCGTLDATTELLSDNLVRVRFRRPDDFHWSPGQFAYLIMPSVSRLPFEAHPFSIASVDSVLFAPDAKEGEDTFGKELVFFIGVKKGFTRRLKDVATRGERVKVYIDGPHGSGVDFGCYDTLLLIAGGTGITFALPALLGVVESVRNGSSRCRRAVLVWSIRNADFLNWVSESLAKAMRFAPPELKVDIQVYLTRNHSHLPTTVPLVERQSNYEASNLNPFEDQNRFHDPNSFESREETTSTPTCLKVTSGRPNLEHIVNEELSLASGKISVGVCGPSAMTKVVRQTLRLGWSSPLNGGPSVTLHVECFGYA